MDSDFIGADELSRLTGYCLSTIYYQHSTRRGELVPILSKLGRRLGTWRADYVVWRDSQRKLPTVA